MSTVCAQNKSIQGHPCFGGGHKNNGRIHLAVSPRCNIQCGFCVRKHDCANESRPGVTSRVQSPKEALVRLREVMSNPNLGPIIKVVGIAGPGDPLANDATFETFRLIDAEFPFLIKCLSTNGLELPRSFERLQSLDVRSLTITINAIDPIIGAKIYSWVEFGGKLLSGKTGAEVLIDNQLTGLELAAAYGMTVKINTVLIPGINDGEISRIAKVVKQRGAYIMNVMPLIPQARFANIPAPTREQLEDVRSVNEEIIHQFKHCHQCRADAVGIIGTDFPVPGEITLRL
jgi:nitrogen fixation protein NifB